MKQSELHQLIRSEEDVRRAVLESSRYAEGAGFDTVPSHMIATVVSELTRNILKYASHGELNLRLLHVGGRRCIEIEVSDNGPGIHDCEAAMQDHFSSGGTLGMGLPGVKRMMDEFTLESSPGEGTRVRACKWQ